MNGRRISLIILSAILLPAGLVSCSKQSKVAAAVSEPDLASVNLSMSLGSGLSTKASLDVITEMKPNPEFRGLDNICLIPFESSGTVSVDSKTLSRTLTLPSIMWNGLVSGNNAHNFTGGGLSLPVGTASALVYGRAPWTKNTSAVDVLHRDGCLKEVGFEQKGAKWAYVDHAEDLGFEPRTMLEPGSGTPQEANQIAEVLNAIVMGESYTIKAYYDLNTKSMDIYFPWDGKIGDDNLRSCFLDMTVDGALMPGSGENVEALLTNLYRGVYNYNILNSNPYEIEKDGDVYTDVKWFDPVEQTYKNLTYGVIFKGVQKMILDRFNALLPDPSDDREGVIEITGGENPEVRFLSQSLREYPERYGLPSGSAVVRWTPAGYVVPLENGLDGIAPISYYCYPPALYYFSNTSIRTSNDETKVNPLYDDSHSWQQIVDGYTDGTIVSKSTRAVVLETPLQYAVGMLCATVKSATEYLQDNDGRDDTRVHAVGNNLPLTGVIIGRQYPVNFDFTPKYVSDAETKQYYLYDDQMPEGINLHVPSEGETLKEFRTLVLETPRNTPEQQKEVYFALEFLNNTDSFQGAEGRILHGHKFYLVGKLDFPEGTSFDRIFIRDHITTAPCVIKTLKNAHNAVPDLGIPQLTLGVELENNWIMSDPVSLILGDDDSQE